MSFPRPKKPLRVALLKRMFLLYPLPPNPQLELPGIIEDVT